MNGGPVAPPPGAAGARRDRHSFGPTDIWLGLKSGKYPDCNQILVTGPEGCLALDASVTTGLIGAAFERADAAVLTHVHEDHMAGLRADRPVAVPEADLPAIRSWAGYAAAAGFDPAISAQMEQAVATEFSWRARPDASGYADGHCWDLGGGVQIHAIALPGHTPGHSALLIEPEGIAFIADIDLTGFGPWYGDATSSLTAFRASLVKVAQIPARIWVTGHHRAIYTDRAAMLADLTAYAAQLDRRSERLLTRLRDRPQTLGDLVRGGLVYPAGYDHVTVPMMERHMIGAHLAELLAAGLVTQDIESGLWFEK